MTYLQFHLVFIFPPLLLLGWRLGRVFPAVGRRAPFALPLILLVAFIYTTPWDNYLVWKEVWGYPPERVIARIGYVPVEEYMFFLLQPGIAGMLFYRLLARMPVAAPEPASPLAVRLLGGLPWLALAGIGAWMLTFESGTYMGLILAWAAPVVGLQWLYMGPAIWRLRRAVLPAIALPTLYLWVADRFAIREGIWYISERFTLGWNPLDLPVEEATFFLITNVLVVFGSVLFLAPGLPHLAGDRAEATEA
jgi:lycopene beta-cyclase